MSEQNGQPLENIWNTVEDNPYLEIDTILESLNDSLIGDNLEQEPTSEEEIIDSTIEQ